MPWRPGERELLTAVRAAGLATALVTTTPRQIATTVLDRITAELGASPFDGTVCGDEVPARKPDPAPYRRAMAPLEVEPAASVVIEDSLVGVTAGLAAGPACWASARYSHWSHNPGVVLRDSFSGPGVGDLVGLVAVPPAPADAVGGNPGSVTGSP